MHSMLTLTGKRGSKTLEGRAGVGSITGCSQERRVHRGHLGNCSNSIGC